MPTTFFRALTESPMGRVWKGFENLRASNALPSSSEARTFTSGDSVNAIFAKVNSLNKNFVRGGSMSGGS